MNVLGVLGTWTGLAAQIRAQRHVVIQHRVHILDPNRINRTVKDSPLVVRALLMIQVQSKLNL